MTDVVVHPVGIAAVQAYLRSRPELTATTGQRIGGFMMRPFPSVRITEISSNVVAARRLVRMLLQADCWAATQADADRLARLVWAVIEEAPNYQTTGAVITGVDDLSARSEPDSTLDPHQPRSIVTGHVWLRPNP